MSRKFCVPIKTTRKSNTFELVFYEQNQHRLMSLVNSLLNAPQPCFDNHLTQASISYFGWLLSSNTNHHKVQRVSNSYSIQRYPCSCFLDWSQNETESPLYLKPRQDPVKMRWILRRGLQNVVSGPRPISSTTTLLEAPPKILSSLHPLRIITLTLSAAQSDSR